MLLHLPIREVLSATPRARIVRLDLAGQPFPFRAGQAVNVGARGWATRRPYSLATAPEDVQRDGWLELLVGVDENGEVGPHLPLVTGAALDVEGPLGTFTFPVDPAEQRFAFIAGGTGIAPLRSMLRHALEAAHREIGLLYSARAADDFAYERELKALALTGRIELQQTITRSAPDGWTGIRGRIGLDELRPLIHDRATLCFICGPPPLVDQIPKLLFELGVSNARIRIEDWANAKLP